MDRKRNWSWRLYQEYRDRSAFVKYSSVFDPLVDLRMQRQDDVGACSDEAGPSRWRPRQGMGFDLPRREVMRFQAAVMKSCSSEKQ